MKNILPVIMYFILLQKIIFCNNIDNYKTLYFTENDISKLIILNQINSMYNSLLNATTIILSSYLAKHVYQHAGSRFGEYFYTNFIVNPLIYPSFIRKYLFNNSFNKEKSRKIMFSDIGGYTHIKQELCEIISEAKNSKNKQTNMTGILLWGPPGTGKTIFAEAIANESECSFAIIDSTDIISSELGASEIQLKKIFSDAKENKPSIIFIDEIENLISDRNSENSNIRSLLNSIKNIFLTYMDGGKENMNQVILIGATNNIKNIDPAFLRSGRFEHILQIDLPQYQDRIEIIKILLTKNNLFLNSDITLEYFAEKTFDFTGADINKLFKIIIKIKKINNNDIDLDTFVEAYLQCTLGKKNKQILLNNEEKKNTAVHEAGHALLQFTLNKSNNSYKLFDFVTISPRGNTLGTSHSKKSMEYKSWTKEHAKNEISILLGGRIAQEMILNIMDAGASNDLQAATTIAENMITQAGFGKNISSKHDEKKIIDEINEIIEIEYKKVTDFFKKHRILLLELIDELTLKEILYKADIEKIVNNYEKKNNIKLIY